jgi:hypothetical protein
VAMGAVQFQERRRSPRVPAQGWSEIRFGRRVRVRLVDISAAGALLSTDERLAAGENGRLHVLLDGDLFEARVEVKREAPAADGRGRLAGIAMVVETMQQELLEEFLRRAGE